MGLQDIIRFLLPREDHFYDFLEKQAKVAHEGAKALAAFTGNGHSAEEARVAVQKLEHEGDGYVHEMEEALAKTFVTPIDREDLQRLSTELDNVLDYTNGAIRAYTMLGVEEATEPMKQLVRLLVDCTHMIDTVMPRLRRNEYKKLLREKTVLEDLENAVDQCDSLASILANLAIKNG